MVMMLSLRAVVPFLRTFLDSHYAKPVPKIHTLIVLLFADCLG